MRERASKQALGINIRNVYKAETLLRGSECVLGVTALAEWTCFSISFLSLALAMFKHSHFYYRPAAALCRVKSFITPSPTLLRISVLIIVIMCRELRIDDKLNITHSLLEIFKRALAPRRIASSRPGRAHAHIRAQLLLTKSRLSPRVCY